MNDHTAQLSNDELLVTVKGLLCQDGSTQKTRKRPFGRFSLDYLESLASLVCYGVEPLVLAPRVMYECGVVAGAALIVFVASLSFYTNRFLIRSAKDAKVGSYVELINATFMRLRYLFLPFFLVLSFGDVIGGQTYLIRSLLAAVTIVVYPDPKEYFLAIQYTGFFITVTVNFMILPFLFRRTLSWIKMISVFAISSVALTVLILVAGLWFPAVLDASLALEDFVPTRAFDSRFLVSAFTFYLFSYAFHNIIIDVTSELKNERLQDRETLLLDACVGLSVLYLIVSLVGYALISSAKNIVEVENILLYFLTRSANHPFTLVLPNICMTFCFLLNAIINYVPIIKFVDKIVIGDGDGGSKAVGRSLEMLSVFIKLALFFSVTLFMIVVIWFGVDIERIYLAVAAFTCPMIFILLPLMIYKKRFPDSIGKQWFGALIGLGALAWAVTVLGVLFSAGE